MLPGFDRPERGGNLLTHLCNRAFEFLKPERGRLTVLEALLKRLRYRMQFVHAKHPGTAFKRVRQFDRCIARTIIDCLPNLRGSRRAVADELREPIAITANVAGKTGNRLRGIDTRNGQGAGGRLAVGTGLGLAV